MPVSQPEITPNVRPGSTTLLLVQGHNRIPGNDLADTEGKPAHLLCANEAPHPQHTCPQTANAQTTAVYGDSLHPAIVKQSVVDAVLLMSIRTGHIPHLDPSADPLYPQNEEGLQTIELCHRSCPRLNATGKTHLW